MITLEVESYCHKCDRFKPVAHRSATMLVANLLGPVGSIVSDVVVRCENAEVCRATEQLIRAEITAKEGEEEQHEIS